MSEKPHLVGTSDTMDTKGTKGTMDMRELLAAYTELINRFGPDSSEAAKFLMENRANTEFVELAETARWLKGALTSPTMTPPGGHIPPLAAT